VHLAHGAGPVTRFLQQARKGFLTEGKGGVVVPSAMLMYVKPCEERISGRQTHRICAEAVSIDNTVLSHTIDMRCFDITVTISTEAVKPVLIGINDKDVGS
jgi:hypothetical protein